MGAVRELQPCFNANWDLLGCYPLVVVMKSFADAPGDAAHTAASTQSTLKVIPHQQPNQRVIILHQDHERHHRASKADI
eukprot:1829611-Amphidinium_carterae.1